MGSLHNIVLILYRHTRYISILCVRSRVWQGHTLYVYPLNGEEPLPLNPACGTFWNKNGAELSRLQSNGPLAMIQKNWLSTNGFAFSDEGWNLKGILKIVTARLEAEEKKKNKKKYIKLHYFLNITANKVKLSCSICKAGQGNQEDIHRSWLKAPMCNMSRSQRVATRNKLYKDVETLLIAPTQRLSHVKCVYLGTHYKFLNFRPQLKLMKHQWFKITKDSTSSAPKEKV